ncbi:MAG: glycosyltransferase, partial [Magnetococcales bacterium]|nr:glycosyltransferase [Magnetococcales bacterium]
RYNLANTLREAGAPEEARNHYRQVLELAPEHAAAHYNLGVVLLLLGEWRAGWREYEWRWRVPGFTTHPHPSPTPLWDGAPLRGKTILLHAEQGLGDTVQFVRYLPRVAALGGRILLEIPAALKTLFHGLAGVERVLLQGDPTPPHDCHAPLMSLPHLLAATPESPAAPMPYLGLDTTAARALRVSLGLENRLAIGLTWAGSPKNANDQTRSLPVGLLTPLLTVEGVDFFSLQQERPGDLTDPALRNVRDLSQGRTDFAATALAMGAMDLIITVDSAPAHVAGALGLPVWLLLPFLPEWRWGRSGATTPWYPSMRLFRQRQPHDWTELLTRVAAALTGWRQQKPS